MFTTIDVSSYQPTDLTYIINTYHPDTVIVRLYLPEETPPPQHSLDQIASALSNGCVVEGYVWAYNSLDPSKTIEDGLTLALSAGVTLTRIWVDCENSVSLGPDAVWLEKARYTCTTHNVTMGIYTGRGYWKSRLQDSHEFSDLPLWLAQYYGEEDVEDVDLFGGWDKAEGKQYTSIPVDRSVFRDRIEVKEMSLVDVLNSMWGVLDKIQATSDQQEIRNLAETLKQAGIVEIKKLIGLQ